MNFFAFLATATHKISALDGRRVPLVVNQDDILDILFYNGIPRNTYTICPIDIEIHSEQTLSIYR